MKNHKILTSVAVLPFLIAACGGSPQDEMQDFYRSQDALRNQQCFSSPSGQGGNYATYISCTPAQTAEGREEQIRALQRTRAEAEEALDHAESLPINQRNELVSAIQQIDQQIAILRGEAQPIQNNSQNLNPVRPQNSQGSYPVVSSRPSNRPRVQNRGSSSSSSSSGQDRLGTSHRRSSQDLTKESREWNKKHREALEKIEEIEEKLIKDRETCAFITCQEHEFRLQCVPPSPRLRAEEGLKKSLKAQILVLEGQRDRVKDYRNDIAKFKEKDKKAQYLTLEDLRMLEAKHAAADRAYVDLIRRIAELEERRMELD